MDPARQPATAGGLAGPGGRGRATQRARYRPLSLGVVGILFGLVPFTGFVAFALGAVGVILGLVGFSRARKHVATNLKTAISGAVLSVIAIGLGIWGMVIVFTGLNQLATDLNNIGLPGASSAPVAPSALAPAAGGSPGGEAGAGPTLFLGQQPGDVVGQRGDTLTLGSMRVKAEKLRAVNNQYGPAVKCSQVTYTNTGTTQESFNPVDWKLQNPAGATVNSAFTLAGKPLSSGQLAPAGTTSGDVCFETTEPMATWVLLYAPGLSYDASRAAFLG